MKELQVKIDNLTGNELVIREGTALPQHEPSRIDITGNIKAIADFLSIRNKSGSGLQAIDKSKAVILVDKKNLSIQLQLDPENYYGVTVTAKLELIDELKAFHINAQKTFTREEMIKLIKFNKLYFSDPDKHAALLLAYQTFTAQTASDIKNESDTRGNKTNNLSKSVNTSVPTEFILNIPIFKGEQPRKFRVEICLDVTDGGARFWFESVELHEIILQETDTIFNEQLKAATGFVIINK